MFKKIFISLIACCACLFTFACGNALTLSQVLNSHTTTIATDDLKNYFNKSEFSTDLSNAINKIKNGENEKKVLNQLNDVINLSALPFNRFIGFLNREDIQNGAEKETIETLKNELNNFYENLISLSIQNERVEKVENFDLSLAENISLYNDLLKCCFNLTYNLHNMSNVVLYFYNTYYAVKLPFVSNSQSVLDGYIEAQVYATYLTILKPNIVLFLDKLKGVGMFAYGEDEQFYTLNNAIEIGKRLKGIESSAYNVTGKQNFDTVKTNFLKFQSIKQQNFVTVNYINESLNKFEFLLLDLRVKTLFGEYNGVNVTKYLNSNVGRDEKGNYQYITNIFTNNFINVTHSITNLLSVI